MRYHNVTTRNSLALLLKVKIPVGAGTILWRASLQASSSSRILPSFSYPLLSPLFSLSLSFSFFRSFPDSLDLRFSVLFFYKLVQTFIGAILYVHNGRW